MDTRFFNTHEPVTEFYRDLVPALAHAQLRAHVVLSRAGHRDGRVELRGALRVGFAYVDFDFYDPIRLSLDFLHQTTSVGSMMIVDDYDFFSTGAKTAVDEFLEYRGRGLYDLFVPNSRYGCFAVLTRKG